MSSSLCQLMNVWFIVFYFVQRMIAKLSWTCSHSCNFLKVWSGKVCVLRQIGNLNSKMAEDSEEFRIRDTDCELQISELRAQVWMDIRSVLFNPACFSL